MGWGRTWENIVAKEEDSTMWFDYNATDRKPWYYIPSKSDEDAIEREKQKKEIMKRGNIFIREEDREPGRSF